ncbi:hypothetical protein SAMN05444267_10668 [Chryseobacterium polytrichastri]|uniref:Uncharacterized protein n=1 Tax=Chryseobacterium polytrichastri TaxID=1302687 RepID=A0A1M7KL42_9FLAO|nr:hypothetical protein SAMN05444267_10668 [Chryseobacterium polytrichastri]
MYGKYWKSNTHQIFAVFSNLNLSESYFDQLLYMEQYAMERRNAWLNSFRSILNKLDSTITSWVRFNYLGFIVITTRKFEKKSRDDFRIDNYCYICV